MKSVNPCGLKRAALINDHTTNNNTTHTNTHQKNPHNKHNKAERQKDDPIRKTPLKFYVCHYSELEGDCQAAIITELWP